MDWGKGNPQALSLVHLIVLSKFHAGRYKYSSESLDLEEEYTYIHVVRISWRVDSLYISSNLSLITGVFAFVEVYPSAFFSFIKTRNIAVHANWCGNATAKSSEQLCVCVCVIGRLVALSNDCLLMYEILHIVLLHVIYLLCKEEYLG